MDELTHEVYFEELNRIERIFYDQYHRGEVTSQTQFDYAWCLIRSRYSADIKKGVMLMEELCTKCKGRDRDYLYFLAVGNAKLKEYGRALKCLRNCQTLDPGNRQIYKLERLIMRKMRDERIALRAMLGFTVAGAITNFMKLCIEILQMFEYDDWGEIVNCEEIKEFEMVYYMQLRKGMLSEDIKFNYAYQLVRSKYPADIKKGTIILESLCHECPENVTMPDILYNLAIGNMRLKENIKALKFIRVCLNLSPKTDKYRRLESLIVHSLKIEGYHELLVAGSVIFVYVSLFLLGLYIYKKIWRIY